MSRRAMLPPMRPKPTIPICMDVLSSAERLNDRLLQSRKTSSHIRSEMHPDGAPPAFVQHVEIASRRRIDHGAEAVIAAGHRNVEPMVGSDLEEDSGVRPALIGLAGRMQEARTETNAGGQFFPIPDRGPDFLQSRVMGFVPGHISEKRAIVAVMGAREMGFQRADQRRAVAGLFENLAVLFIREDLDAALFQERCFGRQRAMRFIDRHEVSRLDLAGFDVGLIERIDAQYRARHGSGDFPAEKFLTDSDAVRYCDAHHRLARLFEL